MQPNLKPQKPRKSRNWLVRIDGEQRRFGSEQEAQKAVQSIPREQRIRRTQIWYSPVQEWN